MSLLLAHVTNVKNELPKEAVMPPIFLVDFDSFMPNQKMAIGGYQNATNRMFFNANWYTENRLKDYLNMTSGYFANPTDIATPARHEFGHVYHYYLVKKIAMNYKMSYDDAERYMDDLVLEEISDRKKLSGIRNYVEDNLSYYAQQSGYNANQINDIVAEAFTVRDTNPFAIDVLDLVEEIAR